ncbi:hypothetical protein D3C86_1258660 [compost metagenome]
MNTVDSNCDVSSGCLPTSATYFSMRSRKAGSSVSYCLTIAWPSGAENESLAAFTRDSMAASDFSMVSRSVARSPIVEADSSAICERLA